MRDLLIYTHCVLRSDVIVTVVFCVVLCVMRFNSINVSFLFGIKGFYFYFFRTASFPVWGLPIIYYTHLSHRLVEPQHAKAV